MQTAIFHFFCLTRPARVCYYIKAQTERYRSGHNGAVLKTVVSQGTVGSNPTLSAIRYHTKSTAL